MSDKDKAHGHQVAGQDRKLVMGRDAGKPRHHDTGEKVPRGKEVGRDEYIDHAGRKTLVKHESSGRVDVLVGDDVKFVVATRKQGLIAEARTLDPSDRSSRDKWRDLKERWKQVGTSQQDNELWRELKSVEDTYHAKLETQRAERARSSQEATAAKERLIDEARHINSADRSSGGQWRSVMDRWKQAGRADKTTEDRLWTELQHLRDAHKAATDREREDRRRAGEQAVATKRGLLARARRLEPEDRASGDEWKKINTAWKQAGRGPKDEEDRLWTELQGIRTAYQTKLDTLRRKRDEEGKRAIAAKQSLVAQARRISPDDRSARDIWQRINTEWKQAGRGPKPDEDRLWAELQALRNSYQAAVDERRRTREADGRRAISAKQSLLARARGISAEDRSAGDQWRAITNEWKQAGRGPKDEEDRLWAELSAVRDAFGRAKEQQQQRYKDELRRRASEMRSRAYELERRSSEAHQAAVWAGFAPVYNGKDSFKLMESMRRRSERVAQQERRHYELYNKAQELKRRADELDIKAGR